MYNQSACLQGTCQAFGSNCGCLAHPQFTVRLSMTGRYVTRNMAYLDVAAYADHVAAADNHTSMW